MALCCPNLQRRFWPSSPGKLIRIGMLTNLQIFCRRGKMTVLTNKHLSTSSYTQLACIDCFLASRRAVGSKNFWICIQAFLKVAFLQKVQSVFQTSKSPKTNIPKNYPELEIWICCLLFLAGNLNFKLRIAFWNIFFEIWRWKK